MTFPPSPTPASKLGDASSAGGASAPGHTRALMSAAFLLAAMLSAPVAEAGADPAVTVCGMLVRQFLRHPESFRQAGPPELDALAVTLAYTYRDVRGKPRAESRTCRFHPGDDGRLRLEPFRRAYLEGRMEAAKAKLRRTPPGNEMDLVRSEIIDIGREMYVQHERMQRAEREAAAAGLYPIAPESTALPR